MKLVDSYLMKGKRRQLTETLSRNKMILPKVIQAMDEVPRHYFVPAGLHIYAYDDRPLSIFEGQTISQPTTVGIQTSLINPQKDDVVLEIGTGSGYQAAILSRLVKHIYTIERIKSLYDSVTTLYKELSYKNITFIYGDGTEDAKDYAPFDKILITAAIDDVPKTLFKQLKPGGILVAPVGSSYSQRMTRYTKISDTNIKKETFGAFAFVPFKRGKE